MNQHALNLIMQVLVMIYNAVKRPDAAYLEFRDNQIVEYKP